MPVKAIKEWLSEYKALSDSELHTYANTIRNHDELSSSLYDLLEQRSNVEVLDPVCHQLFEFYRSKELELQLFTFEFIPSMICLYLMMISSNEKKNCRGIEAFLLGVYNLEIVHPDGKPKVKNYRIPTLGQPSVYHEPVALSSLALTESALSRHERTEAAMWSSGHHHQYVSIHGQNRQEILTYILHCYNADIACLSSRSHAAFCKTCSSIATVGFTNLSFQENPDAVKILSQKPAVRDGLSVNNEVEQRIPVSPTLLIEMLSGLYYVMFNGQAKLGCQAVEDLHFRACYELFADVLLVTNAIRNSMKYNLSGQLQDGSLEISFAMTPPVTTTTFSKSAITNASFRARKLPDDISFPNDAATGTGTKSLPPIQEVSDASSEKIHSRGLSNKPLKSGKRAEKGKVLKREIDASKLDMFNGDMSDSTVVSVIKNKEKTVVDNIELTAIGHISNSAEDCTDEEKFSHSSRQKGVHSSSSLGKDMKLAQTWQSGTATLNNGSTDV